MDARQSALSAPDWHFIEPTEAAEAVAAMAIERSQPHAQPRETDLEDEAVVTSFGAVERIRIVSDHFEQLVAPERTPARGSDALPALQLISRGPLDPFLYLREFSAPQAADQSG